MRVESATAASVNVCHDQPHGHGCGRINLQQGKRLGRPKVSPKVENAIRTHLSAGNGILKVAALVGVGSGAVQRVKRAMVEELQEAA